MFLDLTRIDWLTLWIDAGGDHVRALVHVGEEESRGGCRTVMEARTAVAVTAGSDLEIEGAIDAVLFGAED